MITGAVEPHNSSRWGPEVTETIPSPSTLSPATAFLSSLFKGPKRQFQRPKAAKDSGMASSTSSPTFALFANPNMQRRISLGGQTRVSGAHSQAGEDNDEACASQPAQSSAADRHPLRGSVGTDRSSSSRQERLS